MEWIGQLGMGLALGLAAIGSSLGVGAAGCAAAGAWAKEAREGKALNFKYIILVSMPLTQTFYGFLLVFVALKGMAADPVILAAKAGTMLSTGIGCGLGELFSAWMQGVIGASAIRCLSEGGGKGMAFLIIAMAIAETVGIFSFVLAWLIAV